MAVMAAAAAAVVVVDSRNTCSKLNHRENTMDMQNTSALPDVNGSERTLKESIQALAAMIGTLQRREHALDDLVREQLQLLQSAVNSADQRVNRVVENALPRLTQLSNQALTQTLEPAAERFNKKMANAEQAVQQATQRYAHAQHTWKQRQRGACGSHRLPCWWRVSSAWSSPATRSTAQKRLSLKPPNSGRKSPF